MTSTDMASAEQAAARVGHTALPWMVDAKYLSEVQTTGEETISSCWHEQADGAEITVTGVYRCSPEESNANAEFIVRACNSYYDLLEALGVLIDYCEGSGWDRRDALDKASAAPSPNWYRKSGIVPCATCDGRGSYWNGRGMGGNDPDSWMIDCADCCGTGHFACAVCGFDTPVTGYDCFACDHINSLIADDVAKIDPAELAAAFTRSIAAARETVV